MKSGMDDILTRFAELLYLVAFAVDRTIIQCTVRDAWIGYIQSRRIPVSF